MDRRSDEKGVLRPASDDHSVSLVYSVTCKTKLDT